MQNMRRTTTIPIPSWRRLVRISSSAVAGLACSSAGAATAAGEGGGTPQPKGPPPNHPALNKFVEEHRSRLAGGPLTGTAGVPKLPGTGSFFRDPEAADERRKEADRMRRRERVERTLNNYDNDDGQFGANGSVEGAGGIKDNLDAEILGHYKNNAEGEAAYAEGRVSADTIPQQGAHMEHVLEKQHGKRQDRLDRVKQCEKELQESGIAVGFDGGMPPGEELQEAALATPQMSKADDRQCEQALKTLQRMPHSVLKGERKGTPTWDAMYQYCQLNLRRGPPGLPPPLGQYIQERNARARNNKDNASYLPGTMLLASKDDSFAISQRTATAPRP
ncbi:unnamed protein product [Amoebophrya sp. A120]|nr:unnamed protein product [Amoebophrya sp. A120]|eukprot:GSA120T00004523001.1